VAVVGEQWITAKEIGLAGGQGDSTFLRAVLANLAERGIIKSGHRGYRMSHSSHPPPPAIDSA
jgi:hypothetical protein